MTHADWEFHSRVRSFPSPLGFLLHRLADGWEVQRRQACALGHADGYRGVGLRKFRVWWRRSPGEQQFKGPKERGNKARRRKAENRET